ncbi:MAG: protoheme IX farnesyltransferase [Sphingobacteriales bacterium]|jgi:protoheme IX farnesyltransferase
MSALSLNHTLSIKEKIGAFLSLLKIRLALLVVFSAAITYVMGTAGAFTWGKLWLLVLGGFLVTGGANGLNQVIERDTDKRMDRTRGRALPAGKLTVAESMIFCILTGLIGVAILGWQFNWFSASLGLASLLMYAFVYTPFKKINSFAVFIGAIPGAMPPLIGWAAVSGSLAPEAWLIFAIQFMWQFPHFWSIAWVLDDDYNKGGFRLLPAKDGRSKQSAFHILVYSFTLLAVSAMVVRFDMANALTLAVVLLSGVYLVYKSIVLYKTLKVEDAKKLMFSTFYYLPIVQVALLLYTLFGKN